MTITVSRKGLTIIKNIISIVLLTIGSLSCVASFGVIIKMEGHLDSVEYIIKYFSLGCTLLLLGLYLKYLVKVVVRR